MSKNEIVSMIETMNNYDELASKAKAKADAIRDALKEEMLRLDTEELNAGAYIVRYTSVISNRFDSTTFKKLYADLYKDFTKAVSSRRFSGFPAERNTLHGQAEARGAIGGMKMKTGYARCSTNESKQDIERQVRELKQAGAERVFLEYEHGDAVVKEQLSLLLEQAQAGDTIITLEVSRLARSTKQLCEIIDTISQKRLCLVIVGSIMMDCRNGHADPMTEAFLQMAGVFSQLELSMIRARVRSGMANARAKGAKIGRPELTADDIPPVFLRHYPAFRNKNLNLSELARVCNLSRTTVYKYLSLLEQ